MTFLWGCMVIAFKGSFGALLWILVLALAGVFFGLIGGGIGLLFDNKSVKEDKKPEDWKEWADEQDGELKTLLNEIDKDLKDE